MVYRSLDGHAGKRGSVLVWPVASGGMDHCPSMTSLCRVCDAPLKESSITFRMIDQGQALFEITCPDCHAKYWVDERGDVVMS